MSQFGAIFSLVSLKRQTPRCFSSILMTKETREFQNTELPH